LTDVLGKIREWLAKEHVAFREVHHEPTYTSQESARARGEDLATGAKAILAKTDDRFCLFVVPGNARLDSAAIKRELRVKSIRFATREELLGLTDLVPGAVPPFGEPILPFPLHADTEVGKARNVVAFNAGSLTVSMVMSATEWERVAQPVRFPFAKR
jgi:Ala-tRNA(Pro) deacylase